MKIISLVAENVKRLTAVQITPDGNLVQITGRNGQGKTSVLDSIWWALTGATHIQAAPIRKGADEARIRLDLGEIKVTRTFRRKGEGDEFTTSIAVEQADGARFPSPQKMIDSLLGELSFDPLAFARMKPKEQLDQLRRFVPDVDFEAIENANRGDYDRRTEISRFARQERAAAQAIVVPPGTPEAEVDVANLRAQLKEAGDKNLETEQRRHNRAALQRQIDGDKEMNEGDRREVAELQERIEELLHRVSRREASIEEREKKLAEAPALPPLIDTAPILKQLAEADAVNANVRKAGDRAKHVIRATELEREAETLTERMQDREKSKRAAIAAAKMPIEGIDFGDGEVLLRGVPFNQASDAEQLDASVDIAIAMNPKLRVIRIRDGSLLDDLAMQRLAAKADAKDMQIWIERVDSSGKVGFVLEDGHLKQQPQLQAGAA